MFVFSLILLGFVTTLAHAQTSNWSPVRKVPGYADDIRPPVLVADRNQTIHAFNHQPVDGQVSIVYSQWRKDSGWTAPVDIITPPRSGIARIQGAHIDNAGVLHVVFYSGNELGAALFYAYAPAGEAELATSWSIPFSIGANAGPISSATLVGDGRGNLFAIYAGQREGLGVYATNSTDWGQTWSDPVAIYLTSSLFLQPTQITATLDQNGLLHTAWSVVDEQGFGDSVHYARYEPPRDIWYPPVNFTTWFPDTGQPSSVAPAIFAYQDTLFATYIDLSQLAGAVTHTFHTSTDNGNSWSEGQQVFPDYVGTSGRTEFIVDSNEQLHMFFAHRIGNPAIQGIWHTRWQRDHWEAPVPVYSGFLSSDPPFDPNSPRAVISQGNTVLLAWITDPGVIREGVWYAFTTFDSPELPTVPFATPESTPTSVPVLESTVAPLPTIVPTAPPTFEEVDIPSQYSPFLLMTIPAGTIVLIFVIYQLTRKR